MKLLDYVKDQFKNGPELFRDEITIAKDNAIVKRNTQRLRRMSLGLISCNNSNEWYNLCRQVCEPGTIIEDFTDEWTYLFNDYTILVRNQLTLQLLQERREKSAKTLLDILSRRDKEHWADEKTTKSAEIKKGEETIKFIFEGM